MVYFNKDYTVGEVHSLIGPIIETDPAKLAFVIIISCDTDGIMHVRGPEQTPQVVGQLIAQLFQNGWEDDE